MACFILCNSRKVFFEVGVELAELLSFLNSSRKTKRKKERKGSKSRKSFFLYPMLTVDLIPNWSGLGKIQLNIIQISLCLACKMSGSCLVLYLSCHVLKARWDKRLISFDCTCSMIILVFCRLFLLGFSFSFVASSHEVLNRKQYLVL